MPHRIPASGGARLDYPQSFKGNPPANDFQIQIFEQQSGLDLPEGFIRFLKTMNGGEGFVGPNYLVVFPVEKLIEYNREYGFSEYAPSLVLFGSDGADEAFAFDRRQTTWPVVMVPFIPLEMENAIVVSPSFDGLFHALLKSDLAKST